MKKVLSNRNLGNRCHMLAAQKISFFPGKNANQKVVNDWVNVSFLAFFLSKDWPNKGKFLPGLHILELILNV